MIRKTIKLRSVDDVREFVRIAERCDSDVTARRGRTMLDAKSIVGIMGMDLRNGFDVLYDGSSQEMNQFLTNHAVA